MATELTCEADTTATEARADGTVLGKVLYALLFTLVLPLGLGLWAHRTAGLACGPAFEHTTAGGVLISTGSLLVVLGWWALFRHGGGLPMNAFPPPRHVDSGVYGVLAHPIYLGAVLTVAGVSLVVGSASGLWLVTPLFALAAAALVLGHELPRLRARFGEQALAGLNPPEAKAGPASLRERVSYVVHVLLPWGAWVSLGALGRASLPTLVWGPLLVVLGTPPLLFSRRLLAHAWHLHRRALGASVLLSFATGPLAPAQTLAQLSLAFLLGALGSRLWEVARTLSERIANSWREWRIGPVRLINHGLYAGLATAGGVAIASALVGASGRSAVAIATLGGLIGAGLWAQLIEGSTRLSRPFGFYGGLLGVLLTCWVAAPWLGSSRWLVLAAFCTAAPFVQSVGRLRCLVQGCCHGRAAPATIGIRHTHPRSRVVRLSELGGVPVHPTALYSILWNALIALVLVRAWSAEWPLHAICGLYLFLGGAGRFVEEAYRGEPQTPVAFGLRLYQWAAIASVILGAACMSLGTSGPTPAQSWLDADLFHALTLGALVGAALGVDFPESNRRLSRLA